MFWNRSDTDNVKQTFINDIRLKLFIRKLIATPLRFFYLFYLLFVFYAAPTLKFCMAQKKTTKERNVCTKDLSFKVSDLNCFLTVY